MGGPINFHPPTVFGGLDPGSMILAAAAAAAVIEKLSSGQQAHGVVLEQQSRCAFAVAWSW